MDKEQDKKAYAHAEKAYMHGTMFPYIKVGMQKVNLTPTVNIVNGEKVATPNAPVYIYDTSGPFSDPDIERTPPYARKLDYRTRRCGTAPFHYFGIRKNAA